MSFLNIKERRLVKLFRTYTPQVSAIAVDTKLLPPERVETMAHAILVIGILSYISLGSGIPHKTVIDSVVLLLDDLKGRGVTSEECVESISAIQEYISSCTDDFERHAPDSPFRSAAKTYLSYFAEEYPPIAVNLISSILRSFSDEAIKLL